MILIIDYAAPFYPLVHLIEAELRAAPPGHFDTHTASRKRTLERQENHASG